MTTDELRGRLMEMTQELAKGFTEMHDKYVEIDQQLVAIIETYPDAPKPVVKLHNFLTGEIARLSTIKNADDLASKFNEIARDDKELKRFFTLNSIKAREFSRLYKSYIRFVPQLKKNMEAMIAKLKKKNSELSQKFDLDLNKYF